MPSSAPALEVVVQLLHPAAQMPRYAHAGPFGDLAADLHAVSAWTLKPGETLAIPTGLALGLPAGFGALLADRSSLALRGLHVLAGLIDPGYRGEVKVVMHNLSPEPQHLPAGTRVAQMRLVPLLQAHFLLSESLDETLRASGGFGSTGL